MIKLTLWQWLAVWAAAYGTGWLTGKLHERWEWNRLIRAGKLPKPPNK